MKIPTIVEAVLSEVRRRILDGSCAPGDRLNVDELARELKVSKTPIREALGRLAREGFVKSEARIGWSVMLLSLDEFFQMQEIQHALKSYVMDHIAPYVSGIDIEKAVQFNNNMQHFLKTGQNHRALEENDKFHRRSSASIPTRCFSNSSRRSRIRSGSSGSACSNARSSIRRARSCSTRPRSTRTSSARCDRETRRRFRSRPCVTR